MNLTSLFIQQTSKFSILQQLFIAFDLQLDVVSDGYYVQQINIKEPQTLFVKLGSIRYPKSLDPLRDFLNETKNGITEKEKERVLNNFPAIKKFLKTNKISW